MDTAFSMGKDFQSFLNDPSWIEIVDKDFDSYIGRWIREYHADILEKGDILNVIKKVALFRRTPEKEFIVNILSQYNILNDFPEYGA